MTNADLGHPSAFFPLKISYKSQVPSSVVPIQFPTTRNVLWEGKPVGDFESVALTLPKENVQLFVVEKTLRLAQRYSEGRHSISFLLGSVYPKTVEGGICLGVDRFDPGREVTEKIGDSVSKCKVPTAVVPGDHVIPIKVKNELFSSADSISHTREEFARSFQVLKSKICGIDSLTLSHVISLKANLHWSVDDDELILSLHCGAIVPDARFQVQPIAPLPIIPTALARNLAGPLRLSDVEGTPKMGYVTMDQTRKLLLLLESDPKVYNLPLIGIWISGVHSIHHPYVWASCVRYLNCSAIKDRVLHSSGSFLLLHYSIVQKLPDLWECFLENNESLNFELLSCFEDLHLDLQECNTKEPLCFGLAPATDGANKTLFDEALKEWKDEETFCRKIKADPPSVSDACSDSFHVSTDENPRPSPSPHPSPTQGKTLSPPEPEESLSISFDDMSQNFNKDNAEHNKVDTKTLAPRFSLPAKQLAGKASSANHPARHLYAKPSPNNKPTERLPTKPSPSSAPAKQLRAKLSPKNIPAKQISTKALPASISTHNRFPNQSPYNVCAIGTSAEAVSNHLLANQHFAKLQSGSSDNSFKPTRQPFTQIISPNNERARTTLQLRVRSNVPLRKQRATGIENKENTPLTSQSVGHARHSRKITNAARNSPVSGSTKAESLPVNLPANGFQEDHLCKFRNSNSSRQTSRMIRGENVPLQESRNSTGEDGRTCLQQGNIVQPKCCHEKKYSDYCFGFSDDQNICDVSIDSATPGDWEDLSKEEKTKSDVNMEQTSSPLNSSSYSSAEFQHQQQAGKFNPSRNIPAHSTNQQLKVISLVNYQTSSTHQDKPKQSDTCHIENTKDGPLIHSPGNSDEHNFPVKMAEQGFQPETVQRESGDSTNGQLREQVKRQEDMIRILQEQVRSLLRTKEAISSPNPDPHLPLTPAATPETSNGSAFSPKSTTNQGQDDRFSYSLAQKDSSEKDRSLRRQAEDQVQAGSISGVQSAASDKDCDLDRLEPKGVAIGVNTGASLLWNNPVENKTNCTTCCQCNRSVKEETVAVIASNTGQSNEANGSLTPDKSESLVTISEVDIQADSNQSSPRTLTIDIPNLSLGESGRALSNHPPSSSHSEHSSAGDAVPTKGREFYDKLLCQVKDMLSDYASTNREGESSQHQRSTDAEDNEKQNTASFQTAQIPTREIVVKATLKELEKIKRSEHEDNTSPRIQSESSAVLSTYQRQRSVSSSFIPDHPRLNYVSMSVDDTFDEVAFIDEVASKYLSDKELKPFKSEIRPASAAVKRSFTRTVRFGSLPSESERIRSPSRSVREVDFTWNNLSFSTKNYLTKYNLVEGHISFLAEDENKSGNIESSQSNHNDSQESIVDPCKPPFPSPIRKLSDDNNDILDIQRLKNLPKLF